jgi:hypothetical protein
LLPFCFLSESGFTSYLFGLLDRGL